jgi:hypothetical protein
MPAGNVGAVVDERRYGPPRATVPALVVLALGLIALAIDAGTSQRIAGVAAAVILLLGAVWVASGDAVVADRTGVTVRGLVTRRHVAWHQVSRLRTDDRRRSHTLELETPDGLVLIPSYLLGRTPLSVVERELNAIREAAARSSS